MAPCSYLPQIRYNSPSLHQPVCSVVNRSYKGCTNINYEFRAEVFYVRAFIKLLYSKLCLIDKVHSFFICTICCFSNAIPYLEGSQKPYPFRSVTRFGDLLDFGQVFKFINLPKSPTILRQFL